MDAKADYTKNRELLLAGKLDPPPGAPADLNDNTVVIDPTAQPSPAAAPAPGAPAPPATPPSPANPGPAIIEELEEPLPTDGTLPKRMKMPINSAFDLEFSVLKKRGYGYLEAMDAAARRYPETAEAKSYLAAKAAPPAPAPPSSPTGSGGIPAAVGTNGAEPTTVAELESAQVAAEQALDDAMIALDQDAMATARKEIRRLAKLAPVLTQREAESTSTAQTALETAFNEYVTRAEADYPAAKDPASPLSQRARAIQEDYRTRQHPLYSEPESGYLFIERAAKELGVARATTTPSVSPPAATASASTPAPSAPAIRRPAASHMITTGSGGPSPQPGPAPEVDISKMNKQQLAAFTEKYLRETAAVAA